MGSYSEPKSNKLSPPLFLLSPLLSLPMRAASQRINQNTTIMPIHNARILATFVSLFLHTLTSSAHPLSPTSGDAREYLSAHNALRQKVNVPPLQWDDTLAKSAYAWALARIDDCDWHHHSPSKYGENILWQLYDEKNPDAVVQIWFDEQQNYDHQRSACKCAKEDEKCMCGHYTQLVWSSTQRVGCGNVTCNNDKGIYVVCSYDPPGNYPGKSPFGNSPSGPTPAVPSPVNPSPPSPSIPIPTIVPSFPPILPNKPLLPVPRILPNKPFPLPTTILPKMPLPPTTPTRLRIPRVPKVSSPAARLRNRLRRLRRNRLARMKRAPAAHV